jgi:hypothetical protein
LLKKILGIETVDCNPVALFFHDERKTPNSITHATKCEKKTKDVKTQNWMRRFRPVYLDVAFTTFPFFSI